MSAKEKRATVLEWIRNKRYTENIKLLEIKHLNLCKENIQRLSNRDIFNIKIIRSACSVEAYAQLENLTEAFYKTNKWQCGKCQQIIKGQSVLCDICLTWFDYKCVNYKECADEDYVCYKCNI